MGCSLSAGCHLRLTGGSGGSERGASPTPILMGASVPTQEAASGSARVGGWYVFAFQQQHLGTWESWVTTGLSAHFSPECKAHSTMRGT